MIIYKATSKTSGKSYIGKTTQSLQIRKSEHERSYRKGSNSHFHNAINKYGKDDFEWVVLETANTENELNLLEVLFIQKYSTFTNGYNQSMGGEGQTGYSFTKEHSKKMSESLKKAYQEGRKSSNFQNMDKDSIKRIRDGASKWSSNNTKGEKNPMWGKGNPIFVEGSIYNTMREAAETIGVHIKTIQYRLNSDNFSEYKRI